MPGATEIEGADLHIDVRGRNLADLFEVAGIAVPETRAYRMRSALTKAGDEWRFTRMVGRYGASDLSGRFTVKMREPRLLLTANLLTKQPGDGRYRAVRRLRSGDRRNEGAHGAVPQTGGTPRVLPDSPLNVEALKNFDAEVKYVVRDIRGRTSRSPTPS